MRVAAGLAALAVLAACTTAGPLSGDRPTKQVAELNHLFATIDRETADAIRNSDFLRQFANFEVRTTTGARASWTGRYLYGKRTYIEFFAPEDFQINDRPAPVGAWGLAVSGDEIGFNQELKQRLEAAGHGALVEIDTRKFGEKTVPWFEALTAVSAHGDSGALDETVSVWAMEYQPSYFERSEAAKEPAEGPHDTISRERYQSDAYLEKMMRDIVSVHFAVGPQDFARIEPLLSAAGYRLTRRGNEVHATGAETDLRFTLTIPAAQGLRQVRFALNAPAARRMEVIGRSTLTVGPDAIATWAFPAPRR